MRKIKNLWLSQGLSLKALKLQKVLKMRHGVIELVNTKHGVITYLKGSV